MITTYTYTHIHLRQLILQFSSYSKTYFNASKLIPVSYGWEKGEGMQYCGVACWCLQHAPLMTAQCTCHMICNYICITYMRTCAHEWLFVRAYICISIFLHVWLFLSLPLSRCKHICTHISVCARQRLCLRVCVFVVTSCVCQCVLNKFTLSLSIARVLS